MCRVHESQDVAGAGRAAEQAIADLDWLSRLQVEAILWVNGV
jgi:hypothetical protein